MSLNGLGLGGRRTQDFGLSDFLTGSEFIELFFQQFFKNSRHGNFPECPTSFLNRRWKNFDFDYSRDSVFWPKTSQKCWRTRIRLRKKKIFSSSCRVFVSESFIANKLNNLPSSRRSWILKLLPFSLHPFPSQCFFVCATLSLSFCFSLLSLSFLTHSLPPALISHSLCHRNQNLITIVLNSNSWIKILKTSPTETFLIRRQLQILSRLIWSWHWQLCKIL